MSLNWTPSVRFCAASAHVGWATAITAASPGSGLKPWIVTAIFLAIMFAKEFWADLSWLEQDTLEGSVIDYLGYCTGAIIGTVSIHHFYVALGLAIAVLITLAILDYFNKLPTYPFKGGHHGSQDS